ncbi:MAG: IS3 family transposase, partial [Nitrospira sp.]|nr:IS3 family transposase [Nitrospira sp.]
RASCYRSLVEHHPEEEDMEVRSSILQIALAHRRRYGCRRISAELRRRGLLVNRKRVLRLMQADNLLAVQPSAFVVTTESDHHWDVYLNLASRMTLTGMNQLWVADITYIRLRAEFVYLAVILDRFSRKVVGWALGKTLATRLPLEALHHAITTRQPPPGMVHHSDRGIQGGLKWSSQHLDEGGCDEHSKAAFGSVWAATLAVTRSTAGGRRRGAATVLGGDRGRHGQ